MVTKSYITSKWYKEGECPTDDWYVDFANVDKSKRKVFINIGFNKGYNFALWINIFNPSSNITTAIWYDALSTYSKINNCRTCFDCKFQSSRNSREDSELIMVGVELIPRNVKAVSKVMEGLINENKYNLNNIQLYTMHGAGTKISKILKMPNNCIIGSETCHISNIENAIVNNCIIGSETCHISNIENDLDVQGIYLLILLYQN